MVTPMTGEQVVADDARFAIEKSARQPPKRLVLDSQTLMRKFFLIY
jgi:hypothetical protein